MARDIERRAFIRKLRELLVRAGRKRNGVPKLPKQRGAQLVTPEIVNLLRDE